MRIAMVSEHASPLAVLGGVDAGGQNVHVAALSRALAACGHDVDVYTRRDDPAPAERVPLCDGVTVHHLPAGPPSKLPKDELLPYMPEFGEHLRTAFAEMRPDVVHAHFWMSGLAALPACRQDDLPFVQTFHALGAVKRRHQGAADTSPECRVPTEMVLARESDLVVATCSDEVDELVRLGVRPEQISVVPCGVDTEWFTPVGALRELPEGPTLVAVGRLVERKGLGTVLAALARLPRLRLVVAGGPPPGELFDDPNALALMRLAHELGVAERVHLLGAVATADVPALLRAADVVVCAPWYEPFGIVALEAMACGRPLVATAVGGMLDTVTHGKTGTLVPPQDPVALADAVSDLFRNPARQHHLGTAARREAVRRYDWSRVAQDTEAAYQRTLATRPVTVPAS